MDIEFQEEGGGDKIERFSFELWIQTRKTWFSEYGLYRISYHHPWMDMEHTNMYFQSKPLFFTRNPQDRYHQLQKLRKDIPRLQLLSYKFRYPPPSEFGSYRRGNYLHSLDEDIEPGMTIYTVMFLLGSPDYVEVSDNPSYKWDQQWFYETSPVGGYFVNFKNQEVVSKGFHADQLTPQGN